MSSGKGFVPVLNVENSSKVVKRCTECSKLLKTNDPHTTCLLHSECFRNNLFSPSICETCPNWFSLARDGNNKARRSLRHRVETIIAHSNQCPHIPEEEKRNIFSKEDYHRFNEAWLYKSKKGSCDSGPVKSKKTRMEMTKSPYPTTSGKIRLSEYGASFSNAFTSCSGVAETNSGTCTPSIVLSGCDIGTYTSKSTLPGGGSGTFTVNSALSGGESGTYTSKSALSGGDSGTCTSNSALSGGDSGTYTSKSTLPGGDSGTYTSESALSGGDSGTFTSNSALSGGDSGTYASNSALSGGDSGTYTSIRAFSGYDSGTYTSNSALPGGDGGTYTSIRAMSGGDSGTYTSKSALSGDDSGTYTSNCALSGGGSGTYTSISALSGGDSGTYTSISALPGGDSGTYTSKSTLSGGDSGTYTSISALSGGDSGTYTSISALSGGDSGTYTSNCALSGGDNVISTPKGAFSRSTELQVGNSVTSTYYNTLPVGSNRNFNLEVAPNTANPALPSTNDDSPFNELPAQIFANILLCSKSQTLSNIDQPSINNNTLQSISSHHATVSMPTSVDAQTVKAEDRLIFDQHKSLFSERSPDANLHHNLNKRMGISEKESEKYEPLFDPDAMDSNADCELPDIDTDGSGCSDIQNFLYLNVDAKSLESMLKKQNHDWFVLPEVTELLKDSPLVVILGQSVITDEDIFIKKWSNLIYFKPKANNLKVLNLIKMSINENSVSKLMSVLDPLMKETCGWSPGCKAREIIIKDVSEPVSAVLKLIKDYTQEDLDLYHKTVSSIFAFKGSHGATELVDMLQAPKLEVRPIKLAGVMEADGTFSSISSDSREEEHKQRRLTASSFKTIEGIHCAVKILRNSRRVCEDSGAAQFEVLVNKVADFLAEIAHQQTPLFAYHLSNVSRVREEMFSEFLQNTSPAQVVKMVKSDSNDGKELFPKGVIGQVSKLQTGDSVKHEIVKEPEELFDFPVKSETM